MNANAIFMNNVVKPIQQNLIGALEEIMRYNYPDIELGVEQKIVFEDGEDKKEVITDKEDNNETVKRKEVEPKNKEEEND